uniref:hypothetical protein n=1 Tax=Pseudomonas sp. G.S.17 TaxID=3137451 RepID=UPI00405405D2
MPIHGSLHCSKRQCSVIGRCVSREEKYKAKNVIETVVYRGGDAASGWLSVGLTALGACFGLLVIVPFVGLWAWLCFRLAKQQAQRATTNDR